MKRAVKYVVIIFVIMALVVAMSPNANATAINFRDIPLSEEVQTYLYNRCQSEGISFDFMLALIEQESEFKKYAESPTGDFGLCQINMDAQSELIEKKRVYSLFDEYANIDLAITILVDLFEKYDDPNLVLMAYNMGENGARQCWDNGLWESNYSLSVLRKQDRLHYDDKIADMMLGVA
jgi:hypothetical protein